MNCKEVRNYLQEYLDKRTSSEITSLIENHLTQCQRCQIDLQYLKTIEETFRHQPLESTPPELSGLVMKKVAEFEKHRLVAGRMILVAAIILIGVICYIVRDLPPLSIETIWQESQLVVTQIQSIGDMLIEITSAIFYACSDVIQIESITLPDLPSNTTTILLLTLLAILTFSTNIILIKEKRRI